MITKLEKTSDGHYLLKGRLSFNSVPLLWSQYKDDLLADTSSSIEIDLSRLKRSDSSGLALLIEWYRSAEQHHKSIIFSNVPAQMMDIARVSELDKILPIVKPREA